MMTSPLIDSLPSRRHDAAGKSDLLHPLVGVVGLVLAPLFVVGMVEFVGPFEVRGWKLAGSQVPFAHIGWSIWLLALGIGLLISA
jgi:hypothetical protein